MDANGVCETKDISVAIAALRSGRCTELDAKGAGFGDDEVIRIANTISKAGGATKLRGLFLYNNKIKDTGAIRLARALRHCPALERILLDYNEISHVGAVTLP